uniref:Uncharacterized protein n=2 Tax=Cyprinus carpio TaxID=7962 RepID=A0A8C2KTA5_CYPCA
MVDTKEDKQPRSYVYTVSFACYFCGCITKLVWAILIFIVYAIDLPDLFRAITGSVLLLVTSLICLSWGWESSGEVAGSVSKLAKTAFVAERIILIDKVIKVIGYSALK